MKYSISVQLGSYRKKLKNTVKTEISPVPTEIIRAPSFFCFYKVNCLPTTIEMKVLQLDSQGPYFDFYGWTEGRMFTSCTCHLYAVDCRCSTECRAWS